MGLWVYCIFALPSSVPVEETTPPDNLALFAILMNLTSVNSIRRVVDVVVQFDNSLAKSASR